MQSCVFYRQFINNILNRLAFSLNNFISLLKKNLNNHCNNLVDFKVSSKTSLCTNFYMPGTIKNLQLQYIKSIFFYSSSNLLSNSGNQILKWPSFYYSMTLEAFQMVYESKENSCCNTIMLTGQILLVGMVLHGELGFLKLAWQNVGHTLHIISALFKQHGSRSYWFK